MQQKEEFWVILCTNMTTGYDRVKCNTRSPVVDFIILLCLCKAFDIVTWRRKRGVPGRHPEEKG